LASSGGHFGLEIIPQEWLARSRYPPDTFAQRASLVGRCARGGGDRTHTRSPAPKLI